MQPSNSKHGSNLVNNPDVLEWTSEWVVYPHKRISLNNKKTTNTCKNMDGYQRN